MQLGRHTTLLLDMCTAGPICIILLLSTQTITLDDVWRALKGNENIQPYAIVILFMSLAYICVAMDNTGEIYPTSQMKFIPSQVY